MNMSGIGLIAAATAVAAGITHLALPQPGHDFSKIGQANGQACNGSTVKCAGELRKPLTDATFNKESLVKGLLDIRWEQPSYPTRRPRADQAGDISTWPIFTIQSVPLAQNVKLVGNNVHGYVLARIIADPSGAEDDRYGISKATAQAAGVKDGIFFVVVNRVDVSDTQIEKSSRKLARWEVWGVSGVVGARKLVRVGTKDGYFRYCGPAHPNSYENRTARFLSCETVESLYALRLKKSLAANLLGISPAQFTAISPEDPRVSLDRLIAAVRSTANNAVRLRAFLPNEQIEIKRLAQAIDDPANPAWMACGVGCCTAENF